jgi:hypothetical protein
MQFAPMLAQQGEGGPDISPLTMALQKRLSTNANTKATPTAPASSGGAGRKKMTLEEMLMMMQGDGEDYE